MQVVEGLDHAGRVEAGGAVVKVAAISEIVKKSYFKNDLNKEVILS